jgi:hypothetical protein
MRVVLHNYFRTFDCACGGRCAHCRARDAKAELAIDVVYTRRDGDVHKHYTVGDVEIDPAGTTPPPGQVRDILRRIAEHISMLRKGYKADKVEGYFTHEERDVARID